MYNSTYQSGLSLVSFPIISEDSSLDYMFSDLIGSITSIISEGEASTYNQILGWLGSIQNISPMTGYWISLSNSDELIIEGLPMNLDTIYDLHYGANLISYPFLYSLDITDALPEDIFPYLDGVIGQGVASTYIEGLGWVGSLDSFEEGGGYWFKVNDPVEFSYIQEELLERKQQSQYNQLTSLSQFDYNQSTQQAFYFVEKINSEEYIVTQDDWIVAYNDNVIIGARQWNGAYTDIPTMGLNSHQETIGYLIDGQIPSFKLVTADGREFNLVGEIPSWNNLGINILELSMQSDLSPNNYALNSVYPNPFNPSTTIDFEISEGGDIDISIYNIQGQHIETLHDGFMDSGFYSEIWNALSYPSGVYVVRMSTSTGFNATQKVVLIK